MRGAHALMRTLLGAGVDVCFANPGTSEMHFVAALDDVPEMRAILGLFEGVVTGAADGYGRMAGQPAATRRAVRALPCLLRAAHRAEPIRPAPATSLEITLSGRTGARVCGESAGAGKSGRETAL